MIMKEKLGRTNSIALKTSLMFKNENSGYAWIENELKKKLTYTKIMQLYNK